MSAFIEVVSCSATKVDHFHDATKMVVRVTTGCFTGFYSTHNICVYRAVILPPHQPTHHLLCDLAGNA